MKTATSLDVVRPDQHLHLLDDTIDDPYREHGKWTEPSVCRDCHAVYHDGHWQWLLPPDSAFLTRCPACRRIHDHAPAGYVTIEGRFASAHREELLNRVRNLEFRKKSQHALQRIIEIDDSDADKMIITTTDTHLARGIGEALQHAYRGKLELHYNDTEHLLRVHWAR